ncbi:sugar phosphate isomerase/epimerase family protein [Zhongshania sp.]|uniref:sugar phosphate isomerase/epimerase family protein n=1 Tax=Zhongshania sp. TaxID=1971902 RepID=UPI0035690C94
MTPIISVNTLCLTPAPLPQQVALIAELGATAISPQREQLSQFGATQARRLFQETGLSVSLVTHRAFGFTTPTEATKQRDRLMATIDMAQEVNAAAVCMTSGPRGAMDWREAMQRFADEISPCAEYALAAGIDLGLEPTSHLYADASMAHRLSDAVALARAAEIKVGIDLFACWTDSDITEAIAAAGPMCAFVQLSDYVMGDRALPCRAVPGDGALPMEHLFQLIFSTGYCGPVDLEIIGPRLAAEGHKIGLRRAITYTEKIIQAISRYD